MCGWQLLRQIWQLQRSLSEEIEPVLEAQGLFPAAPWILAEIAQRAYPAHLSRVLRLPAPTLSHILRRLEAQGLVKREVDPQDLRRFRFRLTPSGQAALEASRRAMEAVMNRRLSRLTPEERAALGRMLAAVAEEEPSGTRSGEATKGCQPEGAFPREQ